MIKSKKHKKNHADESEQNSVFLEKSQPVIDGLSEEGELHEQRLCLALQGTSDGLWDWNLETDEVYYSPRWKSMLGYKDHELANVIDTWKMLVHPDDKEDILSKTQDYLSKKLGSFEHEMRMKHKNGHYKMVLSRAFSDYRESDGKPIRLVGTHIDITERKKAEDFNKRTAEILEMIALGRSASDVYDAIALMYEARNPGLRCSLLELEDGVLLHGGAPSLPKAYCDAVNGLKNGPEVGSCGTSTYTGERCVVENIETDPKWADIKDAALPHGMRCCWSEPIKNSRGDVLGAFGMYYDVPGLPNDQESEDLKTAARLAGIVMERDQDQKRIYELAFTDVLTGVASRAHFYQYVEDLIKTAKRYNRPFSLLYIDLDNFKSVNDSLGHDAGDVVLKETSKRLSLTSRESDFLARLSGDEFCMVIEDLGDGDSASHVAQQCLKSVIKPIKHFGREHSLSCSIGISNYPNDGQSVAELLKAADTALYSAKDLGKNRYAFYREELSQIAEYKFKFEHFLRDAIQQEQLSLVYQPQVNIQTGEIIGVEALSRWNHPNLGQVSPFEFIDVAERIAMIVPLTEWVLYTACTQAVEWHKRGFESLRISVNISPSHFSDENLISLLKTVINRTGIEPQKLELEVTESVVQSNLLGLKVFSELKALGVGLAIDDFGTGYSSFASLKDLSVDCLKIDKYFTDGILSDSDSKYLVSSMIDIGRNLGYETIVEGVEKPEQINVLKDLGCKVVQGDVFSKPVNANELLHILERGSLLAKTRE